MDYGKIDHFLAAARHGNLRMAAEALQLSQPALSKSLRALERSLGQTLFDRGRFGVRLTEAGEILARRALLMQAEYRSAVAELDAMRGGGTGHVRLGCGPTEANRLLPLALLGFHTRFPGIGVTVHDGLNETLMPLVRSGEIDMALSSVPSRPVDHELAHQVLFEETGVIVARMNHPLASAPTIGIEALCAAQWILARHHELERRAFDDLFASRGITPPVATVETSSTVLMKSMVMQSDRLSFIPRELVHWETSAGQLQVLRFPTGETRRTVGITTRRRSAHTPAVRALVVELEAVARRLFR